MPAKLSRKNPINVIFKKTFDCEDSGAERLSFMVLFLDIGYCKITPQYFLKQGKTTKNNYQFGSYFMMTWKHCSAVAE